MAVLFAPAVPEGTGCGRVWVLVMREKSDMEYPQGIKWTKQRKNVYAVLIEATEPLTAVQIYHLAEKQADGEEYALSTIYRILTAFEEKGIVSKTAWMGDGTIIYELNRGEHTHYAVCLECHKRIALQSCPFANIHMEQEAGDFTVTGHKLELYGYCKDCRENQELLTGESSFSERISTRR